MSRQSEVFVPHLGWFQHPEGDDVAIFLNQGWYECKEQAFLWLYLRPGDVLVDCGAHFGLFSVLAAKVMRNDGTVLAIEPNPDSIPLLEDNFRLNDITCAEVIAAAVSSREGTAEYYPGSAGKAAYGSICPAAERAGHIEVRTITLDALSRAHELERVNFLKIDVEGSEVAVLEGANESAARGILPLLMVEFSEENLQRAGATTQSLFDALDSRGYTVCRFDESALALVPESCDGPIWYDNLFAATDVDAVNERIRNCCPEHCRIAGEILTRGRHSHLQYDEMTAAQQRAKEAGRRLAEASGEIWTLQQHLKRILTSRYMKLGWKTGIVKKPVWVEEFLRQVERAARERADTEP